MKKKHFLQRKYLVMMATSAITVAYYTAERTGRLSERDNWFSSRLFIGRKWGTKDWIMRKVDAQANWKTGHHFS